MKKIYSAFLVICCGLLSAQMPTGAIGYWPFDGNANDLSGNGNNGVVTGATPTRDRFGNPNKAYHFDGISNKILVTNNPSIDMGPNDDFTLSIWEKAYSDNSNKMIVGKHINGYWNGYAFFAGNTNDQGYCIGANHIFFYTASGYQEDACSDSDIMIDSTWHLITGVYNSSTQINKFYIDGVLQADLGVSASTISNNANLGFGCNDNWNTGFFHGVLDDGVMYKRALSQAEVLQLYHVSNPADTTSTPTHTTTNPTDTTSTPTHTTTTPTDTTSSPTHTTTTVGIRTNAALTGVFVSPNPNAGVFTVSTAIEHVTMEIFNVVGERVLIQVLEKEKTSIDIRSFASGVYYVKLKDATQQKFVKIIKEE